MDNKVKNEISKIMDVTNDQIKNLKRFEKGMSNYTYFFEINENRYVIRLKGEGASKYIDYYNELNAILLMINQNLTSELIYFDPITGTKVSKYIDGKMYEFNSSNNIDSLITSLKQLHSIESSIVHNYDFIERLNKYESFNDIKKLDEKYFKLKTWLIKFYNNNYQNEKLVFCHNDLQTANIIIKDNIVNFIDFEYAGYNDLYYDFACFEENSFLVASNYLNRELNDDDKNHINFYQLTQSLQWYLVAFYKESIGFSKKTNYNFKELAEYFINNALTKYEGIERRGY